MIGTCVEQASRRLGTFDLPGSLTRTQALTTPKLSLPANIVRDAANLSIVNSTERKKVEERLVNEMNALDKRLADIEANAPKK